MKPLIELDSPLYLKRLARELNNTPDGFYASVATFSVRCNLAMFTKGELRVRSIGITSPRWFKPAHLGFKDAYGRDITATRSAR